MHLGIKCNIAVMCFMTVVIVACEKNDKAHRETDIRVELRKLQRDFDEVARKQEGKTPEERETAIVAWRTEHRDEIQTLMREQREILKQILRLDPTSPFQGMSSQQRRFAESEGMMAQYQQLVKLSREPASPERDQKMAQVRREIQDAEEIMRKERAQRQRADLPPQERARREEVDKLHQKRLELMISLKNASPEERQKAMAEWEKEFRMKVLEVHRTPVESGAKP